MKKIKVYINKYDQEGKITGRRIVDVGVIKETKTNYTVKLKDGNVITRKKSRDIPKEVKSDG